MQCLGTVLPMYRGSQVRSLVEQHSFPHLSWLAGSIPVNGGQHKGRKRKLLQEKTKKQNKIKQQKNKQICCIRKYLLTTFASLFYHAGVYYSNPVLYHVNSRNAVVNENLVGDDSPRGTLLVYH